MKKMMTAAVLAALSLSVFSGCAQEDAVAKAVADSSAEPQTIEITDETAESVNKDAVSSETLTTEGLPKYVYCGESLLESGVCAFIADEFHGALDPGEDGVLVPSPVILAVDDSNPEDVKVWGNFKTFGYTLSGTTLTETCAGGSRGLLHLAESGDGYETVSFDDGTDDETLKSLCEGQDGLYEKFADTEEDTADSLLRTARIQYLNDYVTSYGLDIDSYQTNDGETVQITQEQ